MHKSTILGIIGIVLSLTSPLVLGLTNGIGGLLSLVGLILGILGNKKGEAKAKTGIIVSGIGMGVSTVIGILLFVIGTAASVMLDGMLGML